MLKGMNKSEEKREENTIEASMHIGGGTKYI